MPSASLRCQLPTEPVAGLQAQSSDGAACGTGGSRDSPESSCSQCGLRWRRYALWPALSVRHRLASARYKQQVHRREPSLCVAAGLGGSLAYQNLSGKDFQQVKLYKADLRGTDFSSANLTGANLFGAFAKDAHFKGANLRLAVLESVDFENAGAQAQ